MKTKKKRKPGDLPPGDEGNVQPSGAKRRDIDKWDDSYFVTVYELAKQGFKDTQIADALGVQYRTFMRWRKKRVAVKEALERGRVPHKQKGVQTFKDYCYQRLPPELQTVWKQIVELDRTSGIASIERLLADAGEPARKHLLVHALIERNFNMSQALRMVNVSKKEFDRWAMTDTDFRDLLDEIHWHKGNFFEGALCALVEAGEVAAVLHANKTFNASRGYGNKLAVEHGGTVSHDHKVVAIDQLGLSLKERIRLLDKVKQAQLPEHVIEGEVVDE